MAHTCKPRFACEFLLNVTGPSSSIAANATNGRNSQREALRSRHQLYKVIYGLS